MDNPSSLEVFLVNRGRNQAIVEGIQKQYLDALAPILADVISPSMEVSLVFFGHFSKAMPINHTQQDRKIIETVLLKMMQGPFEEHLRIL